VWAIVGSSTEGRIGVAIVGLTVLLIVVGPHVAPFGPTEIGTGPPAVGPSARHPLGTDELGRDVLSRLLSGGTSVVALPLVATCIAFLLGGLVGAVSGYLGGPVDMIATRLLDVMLALPPLLTVLVIVAAFGTSSFVIALSVSAVYAPKIARILRGATQAVATQDFVQAAQARGERALSVVVREVAPNLAASAFVEFALRFTFVIIFVATLNFLGLGIQPPSPNWAVMVTEARQYVSANPLAALAPASCIAFLSVGISLVADSVTRYLGRETFQEFLR
jgi:peptide/nickel transport system permease protein